MLATTSYTGKFCRCLLISKRLASNSARSQRKSREKLVIRNEPSQSVEKHVLKNLYPWRTKEELANYLLGNVVYNEGGLVVINKPYGLPLHKNHNAVGQQESLFSIEDILGLLANQLNVKTLLPARVGEKCSSGLAMFATNQILVEKIKKSYEVNRTLKIPTFTYHTLTIGKPLPENAKEKVGMGFYSNKEMNVQLPMIMKDFSNNQVKRQMLRLYDVEYETVRHSQHSSCSLVELRVSSASKHFLRVFLAHRLAPILGDHLYGNRVQEIMGKRLAINPLQADTLSIFQKIPKNIMSLLKVDDPGLVPTCFHLSHIFLSRFNGKDSGDLELSADPLPYFDYITRSVGLSVNNFLENQ